MKIIYKPKGRAGEYAKLGANLRIGCTHGCRYCYGPVCCHMSAEEFHREARVKDDAILKFSADCRALMARGNTEPIHLSFFEDPYQPCELSQRLTRQAIKIAHAHGQAVNILTKGGLRAEDDLRLLSRGDVFGVTLTLYDPADWEPGAAPPWERVSTLNQAHSLGIPTRISFEPVIRPEETLNLIRDTRNIADLIQVGKLNYHPHAETIDWTLFARQARDLLEELGGDYYLKHDLRACL